LIAVDPTDPRHVFLRIISPAAGPNPFEALAVTTDGGATWTIPLMVTGTLTGFVRLQDGQTMFATGMVDGTSRLFRSDDAGRTFSSTPLAFESMGLSERGGVLFIPTNFAADGFALVSSSDRGGTWTPRLKFSEIDGIKDCVRAACQADCTYLVNLTLFGPNTCTATPTDAGADAGPTGSGGGCGCRYGEAGTKWISLAAVAVFLALARRSRHR
jgi:MYXO-CTERM domain-containing protein